MSDDYGALYRRQIPETCRWCDGKMEKVLIKKEGKKSSFAFGCRECDHLWAWPKVKEAAA